MGCCARAATTYPEVPVVMITAHGSVDNAVEALKAGAFDYIEKPFEQDPIRTIVEKAIGQAAANRRRRAPTLYPAERSRATRALRPDRPERRRSRASSR